MRHEKVLKMDNGTEIKVSVTIWTDSLRREFGYNHHVTTKAKGERRFNDISIETYQALEVGLNNLIESAKNELWQKLKP